MSRKIFTPHDLSRVKEAIAFIENHYQETISIEHLASRLKINAKQLQAGIRFITGMTIHNYQRKNRVIRAVEDLQDFQHSIKSIAFKHGFSSPAHFSTEFKRHTGLSPKNYRHQLIVKNK